MGQHQNGDTPTPLGRVAPEPVWSLFDNFDQPMIEGMPQLAWTARADGFIDYYNPRWYEFTGTSPEDMEGWG